MFGIAEHIYIYISHLGFEPLKFLYSEFLYNTHAVIYPAPCSPPLLPEPQERGSTAHRWTRRTSSRPASAAWKRSARRSSRGPDATLGGWELNTTFLTWKKWELGCNPSEHSDLLKKHRFQLEILGFKRKNRGFKPGFQHMSTTEIASSSTRM